jgi:hypothetical protein
MAACSFVDMPIDWDSIEVWGFTVLHRKNLKSCLGRLCFRTIVYVSPLEANK